jgi:hypothetical protein
VIATRRRLARAGVAGACVLLPCGCAAIVGIGDITAAPDEGGHGDESPDGPAPGAEDHDDGVAESSLAETGPEEASADDATSTPETGLPGDTGTDSTLAESGAPESGVPETGVPEASPEAATSLPEAGHVDAAMGCPSQTPQTLATSLAFGVGWPATATSNAGSASVSMLLLTTFTGSTSLTGSTRVCAMTLPDLALNAVGQAATGSGTKIQSGISNATWDQISRTYPVTGTQTGFDPNDTLNMARWVSLFGLTSASSYESDATAWPAACATGMCLPAGSFASSVLQDDDNDSNPGITVFPSTATGYTLPPTSVTSQAQLADRVYMVFRTEIALGQTRDSCTVTGGNATVTLFDSHVVGCHVNATHGTAGSCSSDQVQFLDDNRTIYGYDSAAGDVISAAHPVVGMATTTAVGAGATCAQARAIYSPAFD